MGSTYRVCTNLDHERCVIGHGVSLECCVLDHTFKQDGKRVGWGRSVDVGGGSIFKKKK